VSGSGLLGPKWTFFLPLAAVMERPKRGIEGSGGMMEATRSSEDSILGGRMAGLGRGMMVQGR
jgi:hypothetical protein